MTASTTIQNESATTLRSWVYGGLAKGQTEAHVLEVLHTYVKGMDAYYATCEAEANVVGWASEKRALRLLYAEVLRVQKGEGIDASPAGKADWPAPFIAPAPVASPVPAGSLPNGTYTVVMGGEYRTIRLRDDWRDDAPAGSQVAQFLSGSDNTNDFTGFAFVTGRTARVWKKWGGAAVLGDALNVLLAAGTEERAAMGEAYALASGRCWRCNRVLTVPASIHRGLGPDCATKVA